MKLLVDFLPIVVFFIVYKATGSLITATAVLIPATILQVLFTWWRYRRIEKMQLVTLGLVIVLGGITVFTHDGDFIKWKPTIVNWLFGAAFLISPLIGKGENKGKPVVQRMMEKSVHLPRQVWMRLNTAWVLFFVILGAVNVAVFSLMSEDAWVNFKLFGMLGLTVVFILLQGIYIARHATEESNQQ